MRAPYLTEPIVTRCPRMYSGLRFLIGAVWIMAGATNGVHAVDVTLSDTGLMALDWHHYPGDGVPDDATVVIARRDVPGQRLRSTGGGDVPQAHLGQAHLRVLRRDPDVAAHR